MDDRNDPENPDAHHVSGTIPQKIIIKQPHDGRFPRVVAHNCRRAGFAGLGKVPRILHEYSLQAVARRCRTIGRLGYGEGARSAGIVCKCSGISSHFSERHISIGH